MTKAEAIRNKISDNTMIMHKISAWRFLNNKIVFTNGCFDVLHHGHVYLLNKAAECDTKVIVIVGLNSDSSVKKLKGESRPVNNFNDRSYLLASLYAVDAILEFKEDTPIELIKLIEPDYLVKGGDYKEEEIVGADIVKSKGGKIVIVPFLQNYSSTEVIRKMREES